MNALNEQTVEAISKLKKEPGWMLGKRLEGLRIFREKPLPKWGPDLSGIDYNNLLYYLRPSEKTEADWNRVPEKIRAQFEVLKIPEAEKKFLGGSIAQLESESVYAMLKEQWSGKGVIFTDMDEGLRKHPEIVEKYFGTLVPASDNKFSALNTAVWSGGSFVYIPKGVKVDFPLQAYYKINTQNLGQFERTLIIAEEGSELHYVEGCSAPIYSSASLHAAVVEIFAHKNSRVRYTTIQNWSTNVYNLVTKRAVAHENAYVEWVDGNIGSKVTQKYPTVILKEEGARADITSVAFAGKGQVQDTGAKAVHLAPNTSSTILSKSISKDGGIANYRGLVKGIRGAKNIISSVACDGLVLDGKSQSNTYPKMDIAEKDSYFGHEASVGRVDEDTLFYLMSRGMSRQEAYRTIVIGFAEPFLRKLTLEYAVELNRLLDLEIGGAR